MIYKRMDPTVYLRHFGNAMTAMCCGQRPTDAMMTDWLDRITEDLQDFADEHGPEGSQGLVIVVTAMTIADQNTIRDSSGASDGS